MGGKKKTRKTSSSSPGNTLTDHDGSHTMTTRAQTRSQINSLQEALQSIDTRSPQFRTETDEFQPLRVQPRSPERYVFRGSDLPKLKAEDMSTKKSNFTTWIDRWETYKRVSGLQNESRQMQSDILKCCLDDETLRTVKANGVSGEDKNNPEKIIEILEEFFDEPTNIQYERNKLNKCYQKEDESICEYLDRMTKIAEQCGYCNHECRNKQIVAQMVQGLNNKVISQEIMRQLNQELKAVKTLAFSIESASKNIEKIDTKHDEINAMKTYKAKSNTSQADDMVKDCYKCGWNHPKLRCPAFNRECTVCKKVGHFAKKCKSKRHIKTLEDSENDDSLLQISKEINKLNLSKDDPRAPLITIKCTGKKTADIQMLPDTGADICAAGNEFRHKLGIAKMNKANIKPRAVNGQQVNVEGKIAVKLETHGKSTWEEVFIIKNLKKAILSWTACKRLGIISPQFPQPLQVKDVQNTDLCNLDRSGSEDNTLTLHNVLRRYPTVFDGKIKIMPGETYKIAIQNGAKPFCVNAPRNISIPMKEKLRTELIELENQGIITKQTKPTPWCAPIVVRPKKGSEKIRLCIDFSELNKYVEREHYMSNTPAEAVCNIKGSNFFSVFDAIKGYHQCPLDEMSQDLTTFITPFGRYKYLRAPYGIKSISEHYNRRMDECLGQLKHLAKIVDDCLIHNETKKKHEESVWKFLQTCKEKEISLNPSKIQLCQESAKFGGFTLTPQGYSMSQDITKAIRDFPIPDSRKALRSYFGLANQLGSTNKNVSQALSPLRDLLKTKNDFIWNQTLQLAFEESKELLIMPMKNAYFDIKKETKLCTDASRTGIGFLLMQKQDKDWKAIQTGSRFLTDTESRYAVIELEMLGVVWAIMKCRYFLDGLPHFQIITDHNPLIPILNNHRLDEIENPRLQRLRARIMAYNFKAIHLKGTDNHAADALSRYPIDQPTTNDEIAEYELCQERPAMSTKEERIANIKSLEINEFDDVNGDTNEEEENAYLLELQEQCLKEEKYQDLKKMIMDGFPDEKRNMPDNLKMFWAIKEHLTVEDEFILYGCRLYIPENFRAVILSRMHLAHQGITRMSARAQLTIYWPKMNEDIETFVKSCKHCQDHLPMNGKEPIIQKKRPERPFQEIAMDFAEHNGSYFLIIVDCFTDWPDIICIGNSMDSKILINKTREHFCRTAVPNIIWSDQGSQFMSQNFQEFMKRWKIKHKTSSPRNPQSNGKIEATVKSMKKIIKSCMNGNKMYADLIVRALLQYRNTPNVRDFLSPAQKLFGHPIQDELPIHKSAFERNEQALQRAHNQKKNDEKQKAYYNSSARELPELQPGEHIAMYNPNKKIWDTYGKITKLINKRRYEIKLNNGAILQRNRKYLRTRHPASTLEHRKPDNNITIRKSIRDKKPTKRLIEND